MQHPEVLLVPILMLADYFLTIVGARLYKRGYGKHVRHENYELNPRWQRSIDAGRWFNPRHLLATALVTAVLVYYGESVEPPDDPSYAFLIGLTITLYLIIVGRHLGNILIFRHAINRPADLSGEARLSYRVGLNASQSQLWQVFLPLAAIALYERTAFVCGCLCAPISLAISHLVWARKHQKQLCKASPTPKAEEPPPPPPAMSPPG